MRDGGSRPWPIRKRMAIMWRTWCQRKAEPWSVKAQMIGWERCVGCGGLRSAVGFSLGVSDGDGLVVHVGGRSLRLELRSWMSAWKIRRSKFSICLLTSNLQKLRKSCKPMNLCAATRMASMSSQPSLLLRCSEVVALAS